MEISRLNNIPDYQVQEKIYESSNSLIYRGVRKSDNLSVIFKVLNEDFQTPEKIDRFKNEYKIIHSLSIDGIIKVYDLIKYHDTLLMVLEDVGGETLKKLIPSKGFDILTFLELANKIVQILKEIHDLKIIHKNINPSNILWNRKINEIKIIDFSISAKFDAENKEISSKTIEGAINYISPEQTNRINRIIDYRTDFYSLGLTFYEMLTGQQAIDVKDPIEIIYWHIAKELSPLNKLNSDIPVTISNIILKLIEKQPEKRYQSCHGLQIDLINCLKQFKGKGFIDEFEIAKNDYTNKLIIPQKLYGRTNETKIIFDALDRTNNGSLEIMLVTGYAGIGKSRLIYEVQKHIAKNKGCFISGKFEQFKRNIPYFPIIHAFQDLIKQILSKSDENINNLKNNLLDILENNGKVISSVIPELNLIIGEQKELTPLPPIEAQNRFNLYFQKFITAFASEENPLILFLDDLQWADRDSLNLITTLLINPNAKYFYLIVAYRHNEIYNTHPLTHTLNTIEQSHKSNPIFNLNHIHLEPLENSNVSQLLSDTLHRDENVLNSLSMLISKKTLNNPLFIIQFLKALYDEKLLIFNQNQWEWKFEDILQRNLSDNIIDIIDNQIQKLSKDHKLILQIASCIGQQFDIKTLTYLIAKSDRDLAIALEELIDINYITPIGNINRYLKIDDISFNNFVLYKFLHDKIQKIAYLSIDEHDKKQIHLKIGEFLLANNQEHDTFNIVNHFNLAIDLITSQLEKTKLAKLNLDAAIKAKLSNAYDSALNYSAIGISLLSNDCWQFQYKLSLDLFMEGAESAYLCANFDQMDKWINVILKNSNSILDKGKAHEIKIHSYILQHKLQEAIETALNILKELDIKISKNPNIINTSYIFHKLKISYLNQDINNLIDLPVITDEHKLLAMRILASTSSATYFANPKLLPFVAANMINISVEFGLSPLSAVGFALYGIILCGTAKDIEIGYQLGKLAVKIIEKFNAKGLFAMLTLLYNLLIRHWVEPLSETLSPFIEGHQVGIETGSLEFASTCSLGYCLHLCFIGKNLEFVNQEIENYLAVTIKIGNIRNIFAFQVKKQLVFHLMNPKENNSFNFVDDNNIDLLPKLFDAKDFTTIFELHNYKSLLHYLFEDYELAYQHAFEAEKFIDASVGLINIPIWNFYYSLTLIKLSYKCDKNTRKIHLKKIMSMQKMMKKWSHHAPNNYLNKYYLVEAEIEQLIGEMPKAITLYHKAIEIAKENGFLNEEALAHELLANFWFNKGYENYGYSHIEYASHYYQIWGANAKVTHIAKKYPNRFLTKLTIKNDLLLDDTKMYSPQLLDLSTILKASQTISEEIILSNLLKKIMTLVIENAGAQKAYFILQREDKWFIEAESNTDPINIKTLHSVPIKDNNQISQSIINYVIRTKESLVLSDAANNESYLNDDYIRNNNPKSILCTPLLHHGKLNGILYLENNITTGAFTKDRLELLNLLIG
ncbi:MAG: AAA family ATPase, partial [Spirochaetota bacterium]|nr:AAA family ATPase [Spirochaetota bacterium]